MNDKKVSRFSMIETIINRFECTLFIFCLPCEGKLFLSYSQIVT